MEDDCIKEDCAEEDCVEEDGIEEDCIEEGCGALDEVADDRAKEENALLELIKLLEFSVADVALLESAPDD